MGNEVKKLLISSIILFFLLSSLSWASKDVEINGLIIDQTRSKFGHYFYQNFSDAWEDLTNVVEYNIVIEDQADPRLGVWISVEINSILVYKSILKPNPDLIEEYAKEAIEVCNGFLFSMQEYEANLKEEKDLKGNGIH